MRRKISLNEEIERMKGLMVYQNGDYKNPIYEYEVLSEDTPPDDEHKVSFRAEFASGKWKSRSLPKNTIDKALTNAAKWIREKQKIIKDGGGKIKGQSKILRVEIEAGESQVTNYDTEVSPRKKLKEYELSERRAKTIQKYLKSVFEGYLKNNLISEMPLFKSPNIVLGKTEWNPDSDDPEIANRKPNDPRYTAEQYIKVNFLLESPVACLEGLTIEVRYRKTPDPQFPCRGGHNCNDARFDVYLNKTKIGVANLNNYPNGDDKSSILKVTPAQAQGILNNSTDNVIKIYFICTDKDKRCHSSTPEIKISRGNTVLYHECTPSISEENDYSKFFIMELDVCGNLIKKGSDKKVAQKDESLTPEPKNAKKGNLVYNTQTKLVEFKDVSSNQELNDNMGIKYLPLYGRPPYSTVTNTIYKGNCSESKIYGGWCLFKGHKINYKNNNFCDGIENISLYKINNEFRNYDSYNKKLSAIIREYFIDNCDNTNFEFQPRDIIRVKRGEQFKGDNIKRPYAPVWMYSDPKIMTSIFTPFKIVNKNNGINFTPNEFKLLIDSWNKGYENTELKYPEIRDLFKGDNFKVENMTSNCDARWEVTNKETPKISNLLTKVKSSYDLDKIDELISKYNTIANKKFTGWIVFYFKKVEIGNKKWVPTLKIFYKDGKQSNDIRFSVWTNDSYLRGKPNAKSNADTRSQKHKNCWG